MDDHTQLLGDDDRPHSPETIEPVIGGRYRILNQLGEGGFGVVFDAEQLHPVRRKVAIKVIKLGMDTREVVARFKAERQTLARMDHPNIAHVLDAGATANGRPYFVMERVEGEPLTSYCDRQGLSIEQRLRVFEQVCQAVQHAHTKGVIHRDLKPSNVLASSLEGQHVVKVIDFGIAKATSGESDLSAMYSAQHVMIGTPAYMSPEQAEGRGDIDTRTDIYALGVLLYQLLTGTTPFESGTLDSASASEVQRIIRTAEPMRPSARLRQSPPAQRDADPARLRRKLRGELDWIVMKSLEKDRARRYQSANAFAEDIERYLGGWPVVAAPPSIAYRVSNFVARNKLMVGAASLLALSLVGGVVGFAWQARIAQAQARIAEQRTAELAQVAKFQAEMLGRVSALEAGKLLSADVQRRHRQALGGLALDQELQQQRAAAFAREWGLVNATDSARQLIIATVLQPAVAVIDGEFANQPVLAASLREVVAERYRAMELFDQALELQQQALAVRLEALGDGHPATLRATAAVGVLHRDLGRLDEAEPYYRQALEGYQQLGAEHPDTLLATGNMGALLRSQGKLEEAEKYYRRALAGFRKVLGNDHETTLTVVNNLGLLLRNQGRLDEALPYYEEALTRNRELFGPEDRDTLVSMHNMSRLLQAKGELERARDLSEQGLRVSRRALGSLSVQTLTFAATLGSLQVDLAEYEEAIALMTSIEAATRESYTGSNRFRIARLLNSLGRAYAGVGQVETAGRYLSEARSIFERTPGPNPADALRNARALAELGEQSSGGSP